MSGVLEKVCLAPIRGLCAEEDTTMQKILYSLSTLLYLLSQGNSAFAYGPCDEDAEKLCQGEFHHETWCQTDKNFSEDRGTNADAGGPFR
jgi:hypothetical protein